MCSYLRDAVDGGLAEHRQVALVLLRLLLLILVGRLTLYEWRERDASAAAATQTDRHTDRLACAFPSLGRNNHHDAIPTNLVVVGAGRGAVEGVHDDGEEGTQVLVRGGAAVLFVLCCHHKGAWVGIVRGKRREEGASSTICWLAIRG